MCLAAVMDLVLEEMHQEAVAPLMLETDVAIDRDDAAERFRGQPAAMRDEPRIFIISSIRPIKPAPSKPASGNQV